MKIDIQKATELTALATTLIPLAFKLGSTVTDLIQQSSEMSQDDKDACIARIKKAQTDVPEWT